MNTHQPEVRAARAPTVPSASADLEAEALERWDDDIVRAARASARKSGFDAYHALADDVAQEIRLLVALALRRTGVSDERYLRRVISNAARNAARQTRVVASEVYGAVLDELTSQTEACDVLEIHRVRQWLSEQPSQLRAVFQLLYRRGLSQREAATRLGVSQPRVAKLHCQLIERGAVELSDLAA